MSDDTPATVTGTRLTLNLNATVSISTVQRFWDKVDRSGDCWVWTAAHNRKPNGYGVFAITKHNLVVAHRFSYMLHYGEIPEGMQIDHRCHNRSCVNPDHLNPEPVTNKQNNENRSGPNKNSISGVRGVSWDSQNQKWRAAVGHNGKTINVGRFSELLEAQEAVRRKRIELFTNNEVDHGR